MQEAEEGTKGRYPIGKEEGSNDPVSQSSLGDPYKTNDPTKTIDPNKTQWP